MHQAVLGRPKSTGSQAHQIRAAALAEPVREREFIEHEEALVVVELLTWRGLLHPGAEFDRGERAPLWRKGQERGRWSERVHDESLLTLAGNCAIGLSRTDEVGEPAHVEGEQWCAVGMQPGVLDLIAAIWLADIRQLPAAKEAGNALENVIGSGGQEGHGRRLFGRLLKSF